MRGQGARGFGAAVAAANVNKVSILVEAEGWYGVKGHFSLWVDVNVKEFAIRMPVLLSRSISHFPMRCEHGIKHCATTADDVDDCRTAFRAGGMEDPFLSFLHFTPCVCV